MPCSTDLQKDWIPHINATTCRQITHQSHSNFLRAFACLSKEKQKALTCVYAFSRIADDCVDELETTTQKRQAIAFWKEQLLQTYQGTPSHPVIKEIQIVIQRYQIPQEYFMGLLDGCTMDIDKLRYNNFDELYLYCYRVAALVGLMCLKIFEYTSPTAETMAINLGLAFQLTNIIRDLKEDLDRGRIYLAINDINANGYSEQELLQKTENAAFKNLMHFYANKAENYYKEASKEFSFDKENKLVAAKMMARTYHAILKKIQKQNFPVLRKKVSLNFFEKLRILISHESFQ